MTRHKIKYLEYKGERIPIDQKIVPLLSKMWALGINTTNSCQAQCNFTCKHKRKQINSKKHGLYSKKIKTPNCNNNIWICFKSAKDLEKFYNVIAEYKNAEYVNMGAGTLLQTERKFQDRTWSARFIMYNDNICGHYKWVYRKTYRYQIWVEDYCLNNKFRLSPQLTFPHTDLKYVESRLQLAIDKKKLNVAKQTKRIKH